MPTIAVSSPTHLLRRESTADARHCARSRLCELCSVNVDAALERPAENDCLSATRGESPPCASCGLLPSALLLPFGEPSLLELLRLELTTRVSSGVIGCSWAGDPAFAGVAASPCRVAGSCGMLRMDLKTMHSPKTSNRTPTTTAAAMEATTGELSLKGGIASADVLRTLV